MAGRDPLAIQLVYDAPMPTADEPRSARGLQRAMDGLAGLASRRRNPPLDDASELILAAVAGEGRPRRPSLAAALEVVTGYPWRRKLRPGDPVVFTETEVQVGRASRGVYRPLSIRDPAEAWEAMAGRGLIPASWPGDPQRRFVVAEAQSLAGFGEFMWAASGDGAPDSVTARQFDGSRRIPIDYFERRPEPLELVYYWSRSDTAMGTYLPGFRPAPTTMDLVVALASDAEGVAGTETIVTELIHRLGPFLRREEAAGPMRTGWAITPRSGGRGDLRRFPPAAHDGAISGACNSCSMAVLDRAGDISEQAVSLIPDENHPALDAYAKALLGWRVAARAGSVVGIANGQAPPRSLFGTPFADLPCPIEAILALWALGYAVTDTVGPNLRIVAPPLSVPE